MSSVLIIKVDRPGGHAEPEESLKLLPQVDRKVNNNNIIILLIGVIFNSTNIIKAASSSGPEGEQSSSLE